MPANISNLAHVPKYPSQTVIIESEEDSSEDEDDSDEVNEGAADPDKS